MKIISSFCAADKPQCIEVEDDGDHGVVIRNTDNAAQYLYATWAEWEAFIAGVKAGDFDRLSADAPLVG